MQTALHLAVITKSESILVQLLQAGANPNVTDRKGCTAVHLAVKHDSKRCLYIMLKETKVRPDLNAKNYDGPFSALIFVHL